MTKDVIRAYDDDHTRRQGIKGQCHKYRWEGINTI